MRQRTKDIPNPWIRVEPWRGDQFTGEFPTLPELFCISEIRYPERRCFTCYDPREMVFTYREARHKIQEIAEYLTEKGLKKGDKVGLTGKNSPEWALSYFAVLFAGGIVVPVDYALPGEDAARLMAFAEVSFLFCDEEKYEALVEKGIVPAENQMALSPSKESYVLNLKAQGRVELARPEEKDTAAILFTSGTTGEPKGAMLSHKNLVSDCFLFQGNMNIYHTDVFYAMLPIHHSYTMLAVMIEALSVGAEVVFAKRIAVQRIFNDLKKAGVTMFLGIPMLYNKILKGIMKGIRDKGILVYGMMRFLMSLSGLIKKIFGVNVGKKWFKGILAKVSLDTNRICICGGGPLPSSTFRLFNQLGIDFVVGYGLTEASPGLTLNPIYAYRENSIGKIIPRVEMRVDQPDAEGHGELVVRGPNIMQGYYRNEEATRQVLTEDGWLYTGDVGYIDKDRYVYLTGRKKNLIVTEGGKNVYPEEIEDAFQLYDEIEQILVKGYVSDEAKKTEQIEAFIYPSRDYSSGKTPGEMKAHVEKIVAEVNAGALPYKRISRLSLLEEPMEMSSTNKIKRFKVSTPS